MRPSQEVRTCPKLRVRATAAHLAPPCPHPSTLRVFASFTAATTRVGSSASCGAQATSFVPPDLGAKAVNHYYDRATTPIIFGIVGDIFSDTGAVLDR